MLLPPIVDRELRVGSRRHGTYWVRSLSGLAGIGIGVFVCLANQQATSAELGQNLFSSLASVTLLFCLVSGPRFTADCLSEEKREGTLGLLFLTDLRARDVLLGKLAASALGGVFALAALFPLLAVPLLLGGVTEADFWRAMVLFVDATLLSLSVGLFVSSLSRSSRKAMLVTFGILVAMTVACPILAGLAFAFSPNHRSRLGDCLLLPSPYYALAMADTGTGARQHATFWRSAAVIFGFSTLFSAGALFIVPRSWQDRAGRGPARSWRRGWDLLVRGSPARRRAFRTWVLESNPAGWPAARGRLAGLAAWWAVAGTMAVWCIGWWLTGEEWFCAASYLPAAIGMNSLLKLVAGAEAGRSLAEDRRSGALELVLCTPLTVRGLLGGQWLALRTQFLGPVLTALALELIFLASALQRGSEDGAAIDLALWAGLIVTLAGDLLALGWGGVWAALVVKKPGLVPVANWGWILGTPALLYAIIAISADAWVGTVQSGPPVLTWKFYLGLWFGLGLLVDLAFILGVQHRLRTRFREMKPKGKG